MKVAGRRTLSDGGFILGQNAFGATIHGAGRPLASNRNSCLIYAISQTSH
jgi:hypothetical protein